jgi:hypothetical protein
MHIGKLTLVYVLKPRRCTCKMHIPFSICKSLFDVRSVFSSMQCIDRLVDVTGVSTVSFTGSFPQMLWSLQRSYLPIQPFFRPHAVWYVSYQSLSRSWHTDLNYGWYRLSNVEISFTAGVTGRQGMLTPPSHLIPFLVFPGVRVSLIFTVDCSIAWTGHWFWLEISPLTWLGVLILTADCSVYLIWTTDFDYWFLRLIWGARRVRPVGRGCLLLHGTWSHLWYIRRSLYAHSLICISF